jgi:signal transduction histidine kinase
MLLAADVLALSLVLERDLARMSVVLGAAAVGVVYFFHPLGPVLDVPARAVERAGLSSGLVGLGLASFVLAILVREVRNSADRQESRIQHERSRTVAQAKFLAMVNHELRTPLTSIRGFASLLDDGLDDLDVDEAREFVNAISEQSEHLARLVDDILVTLKLESGTLPVESEPVDVSELFAFVAGLVGDANGKSIGFDHGGIRTVFGDHHRLVQVMRNLVENAVKYGGDTIEVVAMRNAETVELVVADDGPGIPEACTESVFSEFVQLADPRGSVPDGFGLGLAICRRLVEAMGGSLSVSNRREGGARFAVLLPAAAVDERPERTSAA